MKLAAKLVLLFLGCLALVVGVFSFLSLRQAQDRGVGRARAAGCRLGCDLAILTFAVRSIQRVKSNGSLDVVV